MLASPRRIAVVPILGHGRPSPWANTNEIWVCDSDGSNAQQLTSFGGALTGTPRWSPDGKQIAFDSRAGGEANVYVIDANRGVPRN